jgi:hypothetical protein
MQSDATQTPRKPRLTPKQRQQLCADVGIDPTVSTAEASAITGHAEQTYRRWACKGSGPLRPRRVNGRLRWSIAELRELVGASADTDSGVPA